MAAFAPSSHALLQHPSIDPAAAPPHSRWTLAPPMPPSESFPHQQSSSSTSTSTSTRTSISQASPPVRQQTTDGAERARAYKSRNKRPCDFCRYKKAACHLESAPPCELCIRYGKDCTFVQSPAKRRRPNEADAHHTPTIGSGSHDRTPTFGSGSHDRTPTFGSGSHDHTPTIGSGNGNGAMLHMGQEHEHELLPWTNPFSSPYPSPSSSVHPSTFPAPNAVALHPADFIFDHHSLYQQLASFPSFEPLSDSRHTTHAYDHTRHNGHAARASFEPSISPQSSSASLPMDPSLPYESTIGEPSLDRQYASNAQIVGLGGDRDPYLLARYRYDRHNEASFQSVRVRRMNSGPAKSPDTIPAFFVIQHNDLASKAQPQDRADAGEQWRRELEHLIPAETGKRLIRLFYHYIQPYFPLLSCEDGEWESTETRNMPPCALAAIYGHSLPFCAWDDELCADTFTPPSADTLFRLAWLSCQPLLHTPTIAVLQTLLLLVQRRPTNRNMSETPYKGVMMSTAVSIAQALGLNRNPTDWPIPLWEIKQRKRVAWAVFVQDKWLALNSGRSSYIQADDWDVPELTEEDFPDVDRRCGDDHVADFSCQHFVKLCELTMIVEDILRELFSIRATRQLHTSLEATLEVAKPLRIRLTSWYQALPAGFLPSQPSNGVLSCISPPHGESQRSAQLDGNGSLQLAYITAKIELFRAMLRPKVTDGNAAAITALRTGALAVAKEATTFLDDLHARQLEAFWTSYARANFTIASSFMLLLFVTSPTVSDAKECLALLNAWRCLLRIKSRSCALLNLALLRLDSVFVAGMDKLIELSPAAEQAWRERNK